MSFNFNGPSFRPLIQESQSLQNNGGGGNTGYFQRGKKKKAEEINVFNSEDGGDAFVPADTEQLNEDGGDFLEKFAQKAKGLVEKIKNAALKPNDTDANPFKSDSE